MQGFLTVYDGLARALMNDVHINPAFQLGEPEPILNEKNKYRAIWDTGATNTSITARVAESAGLVPITYCQLSTAGGVKTKPVYMASIICPGPVGFTSINVIECELENADVLVGMDIISQGDFSVTSRNGITWFSFRSPSLQHIDMRKAPRKSVPCSCGSGLPYKKCKCPLPKWVDKQFSS